MSHLKRHKIPKNWPIPRKGTTYIVRPNFNLKEGIPILIIIRDMLKIAKNRKEVKKAIHAKNILLNNKAVEDDKNTAALFDTITIVPSKKQYKLSLSEKGKFKLEEIKTEEANYKIAKISGKKVLKGKKIQINLSDGRNLLSDIKCNTNDSVLINFKEKKIEECLSLKEKAKAIVFAGKHSGMRGTINKIDEKNKRAELIGENKKANVLIKQFMVTK